MTQPANIRKKAWQMRRILCAAVATLSFCITGCGSSRTLKIESTLAAEIQDNSGAIRCAATPCEVEISRQTCGLMDSSSGFVVLTATARNGTALRSAPMETCGINNGSRVRFVFPEDAARTDCTVQYFDHARETSRTTCGESLIQ